MELDKALAIANDDISSREISLKCPRTLLMLANYEASRNPPAKHVVFRHLFR
jgi:hypothetical protein